MDLVYKKKDQCCGCSACYNGCPVEAITMEEDEEGFLYPHINQDQCIDCNWCRKICPFINNQEIKEDNLDFYMGKLKDQDDLFNSTSGGAFTGLSDLILESGGLVCGAEFNENFEVVHSLAKTKEERNKMRKSKYSQSNLGLIFKEIRNKLIGGQSLMFIGCPCQVAGLKNFLNTERYNENLLLVDLICHSIPSPKVLRDYIEIIEKEEKGKISWIDFRYKDRPWTRDHSNRGFKYKIQGSDEIKSKDQFYTLFFGEKTITRPSCEKCPFTDIKRVGDITIADYWGIEKYAPDLYDEKGVSSIMINTQRGEKYSEKLKEKMLLIKRDLQEAINEQQRLREPIQYDKEKRMEFWENYKTIGLKGLIK